MREHVCVIRDIFEANGFEIETAIADGYDFTANSKEDSFIVSVKKSRTHDIGVAAMEGCIQRLKRAADQAEKIPILVVLALVPQNQRTALSKDEDLKIIDIQNLMYMVRDRSALKIRLLDELEYSVDFFLPEKPDLEISETILLASPENPEYESSDQVKEQQVLGGLIGLLENWDTVAYGSVEYEQICCDILKRLFMDDLALWSKQKNSNDGLFRFDLICKIKNGNTKEFWKMAEQYFGSKYIVFEFKNYANMIGQREVFTTVKYLYTKALRGVAILISTHGLDIHGEHAIRGILRDEGKLILSLTNADLINMLKMKCNSDDPADYLSEKLDALLIDLEK